MTVRRRIRIRSTRLLACAVMLSPSANDAGYGGHIWLNRKRPAGADAALWPDRGPNDLFACIGHQGQYIIVSPSQRLTIVRLGVTSDDQFPALRRHLASQIGPEDRHRLSG